MVRKRELEEEKSRLEKERINAEREMKRFRSMRLYNSLNTLFTFEFRRKKKQFFNSIKTYILDIETKIKRHAYSNQFRTKSKVYQVWKEYCKQKVQDKLFQQYKEEKFKEKVNEERAIYHHKIEVQRRIFSGFKFWISIVKEEKEITRQHELKLQNFLEQMKSKVEDKKKQEEIIEIERKKLQDENQKDINTLLELVKNAGASLEIVQGSASMPVSINIPEIREEFLAPVRNNDLSSVWNTSSNILEEEKSLTKNTVDIYETPEKLSMIEESDENVSIYPLDCRLPPSRSMTLRT